jgi:hypothetical protein
MKGQGPLADLIRQRFDRATAALGLDAERRPLNTDLFRVPPKAGDQMGLFE